MRAIYRDEERVGTLFHHRRNMLLAAAGIASDQVSSSPSSPVVEGWLLQLAGGKFSWDALVERHEKRLAELRETHRTQMETLKQIGPARYAEPLERRLEETSREQLRISSRLQALKNLPPEERTAEAADRRVKAILADAGETERLRFLINVSDDTTRGPRNGELQTYSRRDLSYLGKNIREYAFNALLENRDTLETRNLTQLWGALSMLYHRCGMEAVDNWKTRQAVSGRHEASTLEAGMDRILESAGSNDRAALLTDWLRQSAATAVNTGHPTDLQSRDFIGTQLAMARIHYIRKDAYQNGKPEGNLTVALSDLFPDLMEAEYAPNQIIAISPNGERRTVEQLLGDSPLTAADGRTLTARDLKPGDDWDTLRLPLADAERLNMTRMYLSSTAQPQVDVELADGRRKSFRAMTVLPEEGGHPLELKDGTRITPPSEVGRNLIYQRESVRQIAATMQRIVDHAQSHGVTLDPFEINVPMRLGAWVGIDADGNDNINAETAQGTLDLQMDAIRQVYRQNLRLALDSWPEGRARIEPLREALARPLTQQSLHAALIQAGLPHLAAPLDQPIPYGMNSAEVTANQLRESFKELAQEAEKTGKHPEAYQALLHSYWQAKSCGLHLANLEHRQNAEEHEGAVGLLIDTYLDRRGASFSGLLTAVAESLQSGPYRDYTDIARLKALFETAAGDESLQSYGRLVGEGKTLPALKLEGQPELPARSLMQRAILDYIQHHQYSGKAFVPSASRGTSFAAHMVQEFSEDQVKGREGDPELALLTQRTGVMVGIAAVAADNPHAMRSVVVAETQDVTDLLEVQMVYQSMGYDQQDRAPLESICLYEHPDVLKMIGTVQSDIYADPCYSRILDQKERTTGTRSQEVMIAGSDNRRRGGNDGATGVIDQGIDELRRVSAAYGVKLLLYFGNGLLDIGRGGGRNWGEEVRRFMINFFKITMQGADRIRFFGSQMSNFFAQVLGAQADVQRHLATELRLTEAEIQDTPNRQYCQDVQRLFLPLLHGAMGASSDDYFLLYSGNDATGALLGGIYDLTGVSKVQIASRSASRPDASPLGQAMSAMKDFFTSISKSRAITNTHSHFITGDGLTYKGGGELNLRLEQGMRILKDVMAGKTPTLSEIPAEKRWETVVAEQGARLRQAIDELKASPATRAEGLRQEAVFTSLAEKPLEEQLHVFAHAVPMFKDAIRAKVQGIAMTDTADLWDMAIRRSADLAKNAAGAVPLLDGQLMGSEPGILSLVSRHLPKGAKAPATLGEVRFDHLAPVLENARRAEAVAELGKQGVQLLELRYLMDILSNSAITPGMTDAEGRKLIDARGRPTPEAIESQTLALKEARAKGLQPANPLLALLCWNEREYLESARTAYAATTGNSLETLIREVQSASEGTASEKTPSHIIYDSSASWVPELERSISDARHFREPFVTILKNQKMKQGFSALKDSVVSALRVVGALLAHGTDPKPGEEGSAIQALLKEKNGVNWQPEDVITIARQEAERQSQSARDAAA